MFEEGGGILDEGYQGNERGEGIEMCGSSGVLREMWEEEWTGRYVELH